MTLRPGQHDDELISASLTGDLSESEQAALDLHLAECARCRDTLAAFSEERRLISGMRHVAAPRDLGARVRAGIDRGSSGSRPWWRRPSALLMGTATLGAVAAGLLAVVVLTNVRNQQVATGSPTQSVAASADSSPSVEPSVAPSSAETPAPQPSIDPNPVGTLRYTLDQQQPKLEVSTESGVEEIQVSQYGLPIDAALSPDGMWFGFRVQGDGSGLVDTYAYRMTDGTLISLAEGTYDSPFSRLAWSADGSLLAYTVRRGDTEVASRSDVWIFYAHLDEPTARQLTDNGSAFAADFYDSTADEAQLWVSIAGTDPITYGIPIRTNQPIATPVDPASSAVGTHPGAFLPVRRPAGAPAAVVWRGQMGQEGADWSFARGGMLYLAKGDAEGNFVELGQADQQIFDTLAIPQGGQAFSRARFAWAPDGDGLAVWDAWWTGTPQGPDFPDETRVYFAHPMKDVFIGPDQALDVADTAGRRIVHVALAGGQYLAITVVTDEGSEGGTYGPTTELRIITRHIGKQADGVETFGKSRVWTGPAFYPAEIDAQP
jgi:hypothetical protein